jgi:ribonucleoside-diphosphate reductase alpha chain
MTEAKATGTTNQATMSVQSSNSNGRSKKVAVSETVMDQVDLKLAKIREARIKGYEGEACQECGNFTLVRNGTCMKCDTCGSTSGCS